MPEPGEAEAYQAYQAVRRAHELGRAVRTLREARGWSQGELAEVARVNRPVVARFEAGGTVPTLPVLERLAQALEVDLVVTLTPREPTG